jgi:SAM-dependent methyltransferase
MTAEIKLQPVSGAGPAEIDAALYYEQNFVPSLFQPWSPVIIEACGAEAGDRVLDIACGSGVVTRELARGHGDDSKLSGLDISAGMIEVARSRQPGVDWQVGDACALPYPDNCFERVLCQFGLMFFPDRIQALREMQRVSKPGGRIAILVWNGLDDNPGFAEMVAILQRMAGTRAADALRAPFCLGEPALLAELAKKAGIEDFSIHGHRAEAGFLNLREFVEAELRGWLPIMEVHLDDVEIDEIYHECHRSMTGYIDNPNQRFVMPVSAQLLTVAVSS